jgi:hypothetical protein|tara:strand:+ start:111 stop:287 length:177 start_codon:yes stop_codon:yes gene_type:complete
MNAEQELEVKELAFRLLKEKPYLAMEYLDYNEDTVTMLYDDLNHEMNGSASDQYKQNW